ncbi:FKBP12-associated protein [Irineochytrium annulatum]|nr:FKBP12-associated protein [Irineochytrium annulatum]
MSTGVCSRPDKQLVCGRACDGAKSCGHPCGVVCHLAEEGVACAEVKGEVCRAVCGRKRACGHPCGYRCGKTKVRRKCEQVRVAVEAAKRAAEEVVEGGKGTDEVARMSRRRSAAPVDAEGFLWCTEDCVDSLPDSRCTVAYSPELVSFAEKNPEVVTMVEKAFADLVTSFQPGGKKKWHVFQPMKSPVRQFVHQLAEYYVIVTESVDPEPNRSVMSRAVTTSIIAVKLKRRNLLRFGFVVHEKLPPLKCEIGSTAEEIHAIIKMEELIAAGADPKSLTEPERVKRERMKKGFAKAIAPPVRAEVRTPNAFATLDTEAPE